LQICCIKMQQLSRSVEKVRAPGEQWQPPVELGA
jgi:hypothetical protein